MNYLTKQGNYRGFNTIKNKQLLENVAQLDEMNNEFIQEQKAYFVMLNNEDKQQLLQDISTRGKINPTQVLNTTYYNCEIKCKKDKSKIQLYCKDRHKNYYICAGFYDFNTGEASNFITTPQWLRDRVGRKQYSLGKTPEWIWNYYDENIMDDMDSFIRATSGLQKLKSCPVGFINYLKEKGNLFSDESYFYFILDKYLKNLPEQQRNIMHQLAEVSKCRYRLTIIKNLFIEMNTEILTAICKIVLCDIKNLNDIFCIIDNLQEMVDNMIEYHEKISPDDLNKVINVLDTNRGIKYNINNIKNLLNIELNNKIKEQQGKIFYFNKYKINKDLVCIIPTTINELEDEGKQQNNCVGYFYNDSIINGNYKICFIRPVGNPTKSYITCRIDCEGTIIEARYKNNDNITSTDKKIVDHFSKKQLEPYYRKNKI